MHRIFTKLPTLTLLTSQLLAMPVSGGVTFSVNSQVSPAKQALPTVTAQAIHKAFSPAMKALSRFEERDNAAKKCELNAVFAASTNLTTDQNLVLPRPLDWNSPACSFVSTILLAYMEHRPVVITPDTVWMTILQGVASHISSNSEKYRKLFVHHQDQIDLDVPGHSPNIDAGDIRAFSESIQANIKDQELKKIVTAPFSTSSEDDQVAFALTFMSMVKEYFKFYASMSGIPKVTLEGTPDDWINLRIRANHFRHYDLEWWLDVLNPVLDQLVKTSQEDINQTFWQGIVKYYPPEKESGAIPQNNGWLINFFPYISQRSRPDRNLYFLKGDLTDSENYLRHKYPVQLIPQTVAHTTITNHRVTPSRNLEYYAGVMAAEQNPQTLALKPVLGWLAYNGRQHSEPTPAITVQPSRHSPTPPKEDIKPSPKEPNPNSASPFTEFKPAMQTPTSFLPPPSYTPPAIVTQPPHKEKTPLLPSSQDEFFCKMCGLTLRLSCK